MRGTAAFLAILFAVPTLAGCAILDRPDRWDLDLALGLLVSSKIGGPGEDVASAVEFATRAWREMDAGIEYSIVRDPAADSAAAAYDRLVQKKVAAVVAAVPPAEAAALVQRADAQRVPLILVTPPAAEIPAADMDGAIQLAPPVSAEARALQAAVASRNVTRVVVMHTADVFARGLADAFDAAYSGEIVDVGAFGRDDPPAIISASRAICSTDAEGVVILAPGREAGNVLKGLVEGGCRERLQVFASSAARQPELADVAGQDPARRSYAAGVVGVEPAGSRLAEFRALFVAETGRAPEPYAAEAFDAVTVLSLAAFLSESSVNAEPVRARIEAGDLLPRLAGVIGTPGVKLRDMATAEDAAKRGDELDWVGYAHDFELTNGRAPAANAYAEWTVTPAGTIERGRPL